MKKILIFSLSYYPSHVGGAEVAIKEITDRIDPNEITFYLICNRYDSSLPKVEKIGNVLVHRIGFARNGTDVAATHHPLFYLAKILFVPLAALRAISLNHTYRFDGFWAMMVYMTFPVMLLRAIGFRMPYVLTLEEGDPFEHVFGRPHIRFFLPLLKRGIRQATVVHAISSYLGGWARRMGFSGALAVVPNGVDVAHFSQIYSSDILQKTRAELLPAGSGTVLVHVGRMVEKNGLEDIVRSLQYLPQTISFVQIGSGPDETTLRQLAVACGVFDRVHFMGFTDHTELPRYLQSADIFIRPSLSEGMGNSFIEAMAAGIPVIGTNEGGIADFLFDPLDPAIATGRKPTGRVVAPHDPEGIARAVLLYLEDTKTTEQIVQNACALVIEQFDWKYVVDSMRTRVFSIFTGI